MATIARNSRTIQDVSPSASIAYPSKERQDCVYAIRYIRWLIETEATIEAGPDAFALLVAVVIAEDRIRYSRPPNFYNEQLCRNSGIGSVPALIRARNRALELGLLHYSSGAKRRPGTYFVYGFPNDSLQKAEGIRKESEKKTTPSIPSPSPRLKPKPERGAREKPSIDVVMEYWKANSLNGDPEDYYDYYSANGWTQGKSEKPIKDWQATARRWSRRQPQFAPTKAEKADWTKELRQPPKPLFART